MPNYQITVDSETVQGLFQGDAGLAKLLEQVLNQVLEAQVSEQLEQERVRACAVLIAIGINAAGYREIVGIQLGDSESEGSWSSFFGWLTRRGLAGADLVVSDAHTGLVAAAQRHFQGCTWQRCQAHLAGDVLEAAPTSVRQGLHEQLRILFEAPNLPTARLLLEQLLATYAARAPKAIAILEAGFDDATAVLALPEPYRRRLRTSNGMERLNEEVRRREHVIRIFPNRESAIRLLGAVLMERHEQWVTGHRSFDLATYWQWQHVQRLRPHVAIDTVGKATSNQTA